jgi:hypothetical protein
MSKQKKCPICEEIFFRYQKKCLKCGWDLKIYYFNEEGIFNEQKTKIKWAKQIWHSYTELLEAYNLQKDNILNQEERISKLEEEIINLNNLKIDSKIADIRLSKKMEWTKDIELLNNIKNEYNEYINVKFVKKLFYVHNSSNGWWLIADDPEDALSVSMRQTTTRNANNLSFEPIRMLEVYQFWKILVFLYSKYENFLDCIYTDLDCLYHNEDYKKRAIMKEVYISNFDRIKFIVLPKYGLFKLLEKGSSGIVQFVQTKE